MPTYTYQCEDCKNTYDKFNNIKDHQQGGACPSCGSLETVQQMNAVLGIKGGYMDKHLRVSK